MEDTAGDIYSYAFSNIEELDKDVTGEMANLLQGLGYDVSYSGNTVTVSPKNNVEIKSDVSKETEKINVPSSSNSGDNLISIMKQDSNSKVKAINEQTKAIKNQNALLKKQNDLNLEHIKFVKQQNDLLASISALKIKEINSLTSQESALKNSVIVGSYANSHLLGQRSSLGSINTNLEKNMEQNKKPLESQQKYHDFQLEGNEKLKDSNGNQIKPLESKALKDAEFAISQKDINSTVADDVLEFIADELYFLTDLTGDVVSDTLDSQSGFSEFNPINFMLDELKKESELETKKEMEGLKNG